MTSAIIARLGLDTKDFNRDLGNAEKRTGQFAKKAETNLKTATKASNTLGQSIGNIGKQWISGAIGAFSGVVAFSAIYEGIKASKELRNELKDVLKPINPQFATLEELHQKLEKTKEVSEKASKNLNSTWGRSINDLGGRFATLIEALMNPRKAMKGQIKHVDRNKEQEADAAAAQAQAIELERAIAKKGKQTNDSHRIRMYQSEEKADQNDAARKRDEALGAVKNYVDPEAKKQAEANIKTAYNQEMAAIHMKYRALEDEQELREKIANLTGTASQRSIAALKLEIEYLTRKAAIESNTEKKRDLEVQLGQKQASLRDVEVAELRKTPAQKEADRREAAEQRRAERVIAARQRDKEQRAEWAGEKDRLWGTLRPLAGSTGEMGGPTGELAEPKGPLPFEGGPPEPAKWNTERFNTYIERKRSRGVPGEPGSSKKAGGKGSGATLDDVVKAIGGLKGAVEAPPVNR